MNFTNEQKKAIETRNADILVSAAAGSGKTAVLVERIISLITDSETDINIDNLLVVTFTEAAGKEMRLRIEKRLNEMLEITPNDINIRKQLVLLNRAYISTIHSFCKKIISQNFNKLEIDTNFRIADNLEKNLIEEEVLDNVLEQYYSKENNENFINLLEMYSENIEDVEFRKVIFEIYNKSLNHREPMEWIKKSVELHKINSLNGTLIEKIVKEDIEQKLAKSIMTLERGIKLVENEIDLEKVQVFLTNECSQFLDFYNKIHSYSYDEIYKHYSDMALARYPSISRKKLEINVADIADNAKDLRDISKKIFTDLEKYLFDDEESTIKIINSLCPYVEELANIIMEYSDELLKEKYKRNVLTFNDLEHLTINILVNGFENEEPVLSDIAKKYQNRFAEIIIDEYQDTNEVQDLILTSISRKSLNKPNKFMVGDVKQSIYMFRGGDPKLFIEKYNNYTYDEQSHYQKIDLSKNFRSSKSVIQLVNFVFMQNMQKETGGISYDENAKLYIGREDDYKLETEIILCDFDDEKDEKQEKNIEQEKNAKSKSQPDNKFESEQVFEFEVIAKRIDELVNNTENSTQIKYSDIAILFRSRKYIDDLTDILNKYGIPSTSKTVGNFYDNYEIQLVLSYLQIVDNPLNDLALLAVLKSPIYSLTDDELIKISYISKNEHIFNKLENKYKDCLNKSNNEDEENNNLISKLELFFEDYKYFKNISSDMSISEFLLRLYERVELYTIVLAFKTGETMVLNLMYLIEKAVDFEKTSFTTIFNFVRYIEKVKTEESNDNIKKVDSSNSVRIMTIHESKGLEFPIVFVANLNKGFNFTDTKNKIISTHDLGFTSKFLEPKNRVLYNSLVRQIMSNMLKKEIIAEELRVFYVALTRAREKLILTSYIKDMDKEKKLWNDRFNTNDIELLATDILSCDGYLDFLMKSIYANEKAYFLHNEETKIEDLFNFDLPMNIDIKKASTFKKLTEVSEIKETDELNVDISFNDYKYKFEPFTKLPTYTTISEIKRKFNALDTEGQDIVYDIIGNKNIENTENIDCITGLGKSNIVKKVPHFVSEEKITPTKRGTAIHKVFEKIDFSSSVDIDDIEDCMNDLLMQNQITDTEYKAINKYKYAGFFESNVYNRILIAKNVYKEQIFTLGISVDEIYPEIMKDIDVDVRTEINYDNKKIIVKGMIDCFFEEDDGYVLIDFKTDYVNMDNIDEVIDKYKIQLNLYGTAIEKSTNKKVKEKYIYLYNIEKFVLVD